MKISLPFEAYEAIAEGSRTAVFVAEPEPLRFMPGDRLLIEPLAASAECSGVTVMVTDVDRSLEDGALLSVRRLSDITTVSTPGGVIRAHADPDDVYPGFALTINEALAAVVEWHPGHQSLVIRTYNQHDEEPQSSHRWDGAAVEPL